MKIPATVQDVVFKVPAPPREKKPMRNVVKPRALRVARNSNDSHVPLEKVEPDRKFHQVLFDLGPADLIRVLASSLKGQYPIGWSGYPGTEDQEPIFHRRLAPPRQPSLQEVALHYYWKLRQPVVNDSDSFCTNLNSNSDTKPIRKRGTARCSRCLNHEVNMPLKGHKRYCFYKYCICTKCLSTAERQVIMAAETAKRRNEKQDRERVLLDGEVYRPFIQWNAKISSSPFKLVNLNRKLCALKRTMEKRKMKTKLDKMPTSTGHPGAELLGACPTSEALRKSQDLSQSPDSLGARLQAHSSLPQSPGPLIVPLQELSRMQSPGNLSACLENPPQTPSPGSQELSRTQSPGTLGAPLQSPSQTSSPVPQDLSRIQSPDSLGARLQALSSHPQSPDPLIVPLQELSRTQSPGKLSARLKNPPQTPSPGLQDLSRAQSPGTLGAPLQTSSPVPQDLSRTQSPGLLLDPLQNPGLLGIPLKNSPRTLSPDPQDLSDAQSPVALPLPLHDLSRTQSPGKLGAPLQDQPQTRSPGPQDLFRTQSPGSLLEPLENLSVTQNPALLNICLKSSLRAQSPDSQDPSDAQSPVTLPAPQQDLTRTKSPGSLLDPPLNLSVAQNPGLVRIPLQNSPRAQSPDSQDSSHTQSPGLLAVPPQDPSMTRSPLMGSPLQNSSPERNPSPQDPSSTQGPCWMPTSPQGSPRAPWPGSLPGHLQKPLQVQPPGLPIDSSMNSPEPPNANSPHASPMEVVQTNDQVLYVFEKLESMTDLLQLTLELLNKFEYTWDTIPLMYLILKSVMGDREKASRLIREVNDEIRKIYNYHCNRISENMPSPGNEASVCTTEAIVNGFSPYQYPYSQ